MVTSRDTKACEAAEIGPCYSKRPDFAGGEFMLTFALFPLVLFFIGAFLVTGLPVALSLQTYFQNRGRQPVMCPQNGEPVDVEVDNKFGFWTALRGQEHSRLASCTRWPEKGDCGQECLAQVDPSPENVERLMIGWYKGKVCAICLRGITPSDWRRGRLGWLDAQHKLVELRQVNLRQLQSALQEMRPLCWICHQEERVRQAIPPRVLKGDRLAMPPAIARLSGEAEAL